MDSVSVNFSSCVKDILKQSKIQYKFTNVRLQTYPTIRFIKVNRYSVVHKFVVFRFTLMKDIDENKFHCRTMRKNLI